MTNQKAPPAARKVLHLIDTGGPGGAEMVLDIIVGNLPPERWRSLVVLPIRGWLAQRLEARGVKTVIVPSLRAADVRYLRGLTRVIREFEPDVIHAHLLGAGVYGSLAAMLTGDLPLVCTFHGRPDVSPADRMLPIKARILSRRRNRIAFVSRDLREYLEPLMGLPERSCRLVYNGVEFAEPQPTGTERGECGAGPENVLIGAVGNVRPAKDYATLLHAAAVVCAARPEARFAIAGDDRSPLMEHLSRLVAQLGLGDKVRFLGFRNDAAALVASFDLFVSSSSTEGLPLGVVEAVALGTPVVLTRVGGIPEVVESGRTGTLVPPGDPGALAAGILQALADPERTSRLAEAGACDVRSRFSAERMCAEYEDLYSTLIDHQ